MGFSNRYQCDMILYCIGGHLGRDKTYEKIAERYYWNNLWRDVQDFVQHCDTCQRTNDAKFQKQAVPLHPIPVKSKVWNQIYYMGVSIA